MTYLNLVPGDLLMFDPTIIVVRSDLSEYVRGDVFYLISNAISNINSTMPQIIKYVFNTKRGIITVAFYIDANLSLLFKRI